MGRGIPEELARRFRLGRCAAGLSQRQVALRCDLPIEVIVKTELRIRYPRRDEWKKLCRAIHQEGLIPLLNGEEAEITPGEASGA